MWSGRGLDFGFSLLGMLLMAACGGDSIEPNGAGGASGFPGLGGGHPGGSPTNTGNWFLEPIQGVDNVDDPMAPSLGAHCVPRPIESDADGRISCVVVEVRESDAVACAPCGGAGTPGRTPTEPSLEPAVDAWLEENEVCGGTTGKDCRFFCPCQLTQFGGAALADCQQSPAPPTDPGFCYVQASPRENEDPNDPAVLGRQAVVAHCPDGSLQMLRFAVDLPASGVPTLLACQARAIEALARWRLPFSEAAGGGTQR
jgi:hypothetical protein